MAFINKTFSWIVLTLVISLFSRGSVLAQALPFTNHTEIGVLQNNQSLGPHTSFTFQTFNGVKANNWLSIGFTTGLDNYNQTIIIPFALGARAVLPSEGKISFLGGLDTGVGSVPFEKDSRTSWTEGGFLLNPIVGMLIKTKGKGQFSLSLGYKRQVISKSEGTLDPGNTNGSNGLPPGYRSIFRETFIYNRASIRLGVFF